MVIVQQSTFKSSGSSRCSRGSYTHLVTPIHDDAVAHFVSLRFTNSVCSVLCDTTYANTANIWSSGVVSIVDSWFNDSGATCREISFPAHRRIHVGYRQQRRASAWQNKTHNAWCFEIITELIRIFIATATSCPLKFVSSGLLSDIQMNLFTYCRPHRRGIYSLMDMWKLHMCCHPYRRGIWIYSLVRQHLIKGTQQPCPQVHTLRIFWWYVV